VTTTTATCPAPSAFPTPAAAAAGLGVRLPVLVLLVKAFPGEPFTLEVALRDDAGRARRLRASTFQSVPRVAPAVAALPLRLPEGWAALAFDLHDFCRRAYGTGFAEATRVTVRDLWGAFVWDCFSGLGGLGGAPWAPWSARVEILKNLSALLWIAGRLSTQPPPTHPHPPTQQIHANCRLRRVYFAARAAPEAELPPEFRLYLPRAAGGRAGAGAGGAGVAAAPAGPAEAALEEGAAAAPAEGEEGAEGGEEVVVEAAEVEME
jgi:hypothetical protein